MLYDRFDPILKNDYPNRAVTLDGKPLPYGGQDTFNDNTLALRGQLLFEPSDDADFLLIGSYARTNEGTAPFLELPTVPIFDAAGNHVGTIVAGPNETREAMLPDGTPIYHPLSFDPDLLRPPGGNLYGPSCTPKDRKNLKCAMDFAFEHLNSTDTWGVTGKLTWNFGDKTTLTSVTDYKHFEKFQGIPADGGPASTINVLFDAEAHTFSQEIRLNGESERFRWVTGAYYLNITLDAGVAITADANYPVRAAGRCPVGGCGSDQPGDQFLVAVRTGRIRSDRQVDADRGTSRHSRGEGFHRRGDVFPQHQPGQARN